MKKRVKVTFLFALSIAFAGQQATAFDFSCSLLKRPWLGLVPSAFGASLLYTTRQAGKQVAPKNSVTNFLQKNSTLAYLIGAGCCTWGLWTLGKTIFASHQSQKEEKKDDTNSTPFSGVPKTYFDGGSAWIEPVFLALRNIPELVKHVQENRDKYDNEPAIKEFALLLEKSFKQECLSKQDVKKFYELMRTPEFGVSTEPTGWGSMTRLLSVLLKKLKVNLFYRYRVNQSGVLKEFTWDSGIVALHLNDNNKEDAFMRSLEVIDPTESAFGTYIIFSNDASSNPTKIPTTIYMPCYATGNEEPYELIACIKINGGISNAYIKNKNGKQQWWYCSGLNRPNVMENNFEKAGFINANPQVLIYKKSRWANNIFNVDNSNFFDLKFHYNQV